MRRNLSAEELGDLLTLPICATLATTRRDGSTVLSPVWHQWRDGGFEIPTGTDDIKVRHIRRNPRVNVVVYDNEPPYRGLEVRGKATIRPDPDHQTERAIAQRYLGQERGDAFMDSVTWESVVIRVEPGDFRGWDFVDDYGERTRS